MCLPLFGVTWTSYRLDSVLHYPDYRGLQRIRTPNIQISTTGRMDMTVKQANWLIQPILLKKRIDFILKIHTSIKETAMQKSPNNPCASTFSLEKHPSQGVFASP